MKAYICDQCGKQQEPGDRYGEQLGPSGWFTLHHRQPNEGAVTTHHLCSPSCVLGHIDAEYIPRKAEAVRG